MTAKTAARPVVPWAGQCPKWCDVDHGNDIPEDVFHRSAFAVLKPDASRSGWEGAWELHAHVVVPEVKQGDDPGLLVIDTQAGTAGPSVELDVTQVDEFIRQQKVFLARVEQMRDQLTHAVEEQQS
ncbi:DUF6907 domain-containing protein [Streptomyces pseudovenezuelae]|uniref:DUF6907 domain-containing protein n=1 Tax=Streptomyces pseudovenezuelae TaxID=67350 RepID=UPI0036E1DB02